MIRKLAASLSLLSFACSTFAATTHHAVQATQLAQPASWSNIKHVVVIYLENTSAGSAEKQPYLKSLMTRGAYLSNYFAITHPSEPNYIAFAAADTLGVNNDSVHDLNGTHLGNLFDQKCLTWKVYAEDLPNSTCFTGASSGFYVRKHEPFISFTSVQNTPADCSKIQNSDAFFKDIAANNLPSFSFYVPNLRDDGHDTGVAFADTWLKNTFDPIFSNPQYMKDTVFMITFDEDDGSQSNKVYTVLYGAGVKAGAQSNVKYNHYSLVRTVEDIFGLGNMGRNDVSATPITDVWS